MIKNGCGEEVIESRKSSYECWDDNILATHVSESEANSSEKLS